MFDFSYWPNNYITRYFSIVKVQMFSLRLSFFLYSIPINIIRVQVKHAPCLSINSQGSLRLTLFLHQMNKMIVNVIQYQKSITRSLHLW